MIGPYLPLKSPNQQLNDAEMRDADLASDDGSLAHDERIFDKLYRDALHHHKKREEISTMQPSHPASHPVNLETFERLHNEHRTRLEKREKKTDQFFGSFITQHPAGKSDPERLDRLQKPRLARNPSAPELSSSDRPRSKGPSSRIISLYEDHQTRTQRFEASRKVAEQKRLQEEMSSLKNFGARRSDPDTFDRLYKEAVDWRIKKENVVKEDEARVEASLVKPKGTLNPDTFIRLYEGALQRDQKITDAKTKKELSKKREMEETSVHKKASGDDQVFERLYRKKANNEFDTTDSGTVHTPKRANLNNSMEMLNSSGGSRFTSWSNNTGTTPDHRPSSRRSTNIRMMGDEDVSEGVKDARRRSTNIRMMGDEDVSEGVKDARRHSTNIRMMGDEDVLSEDVKNARRRSTNIRMMGDEDVLSEGVKDTRPSGVRGMKQREGDDGQRLSTSLDYDMPDSTLVLPMQLRRMRGSENTTPQKASPRNARPFPQSWEEEIRNRLLEDEWNKRPTDVRSNLVMALHSKHRSRANGEK